MTIGFVWQGVSQGDTFNRWNDGLRHAMRILESEHTVRYMEPWDPCDDVDVFLYWEAPCTARGQNAQHYDRIRTLDKPKALLFAGGPIEWETARGFDHIFVENECNKTEFEHLGFSTSVAFGVNTDDFRPKRMEKKFDAFFHATFAGWKRHELFADAFGARGAVAGRVQEHDRAGYNRCQELGVTIYPEADAKTLARYIAEAHVMVNTSEFWGGGQRTTLEAMSCNAPVLVMSDSPKNREYVEESGQGEICDPDPLVIRETVESMKGKRYKGRAYVLGKWTPQHYADNLNKVITCL